MTPPLIPSMYKSNFDLEYVREASIAGLNSSIRGHRGAPFGRGKLSIQSVSSLNSFLYLDDNDIKAYPPGLKKQELRKRTVKKV